MKFLLFLIHLVTNLCAQFLLLSLLLYSEREIFYYDWLYDWHSVVPSGIFVFAVCTLLLCLDFFSVRALSRSGKLRVLNPALAHFFDAVLAMPPLAVGLFSLFFNSTFYARSAPGLVILALVLLSEALFALTRILLYRESAKSPPADGDGV